MIHITLRPARKVSPDKDEFGRSEVGFDEEMSDEELYKANHGCWVLGARAYREQFALLSFGGIVRQAIAIERIIPAGARRAIEGKVLGPGNPVYDAYVGLPSPILGVRNPITYFDSPVDRR